MEARGRARATITRRLCTIAGFYKYAVEEELLEHSPAAHVRRPRLDYESHAVGLDRHGAARIVRRAARRAGYQQTGGAAYAATCVHYRSVGCRGAAAGCAGSRLACRSPHHDEIRPCPRQPGLARDPHRLAAYLAGAAR